MNLREYLSENFVSNVRLSGRTTREPYNLTFSSTYELVKNFRRNNTLSPCQAFYLYNKLIYAPLDVKYGKLFNRNKVAIGVFIRGVDKLIQEMDSCPATPLEFAQFYFHSYVKVDFEIGDAYVSRTPETSPLDFPTALTLQSLQKSHLIAGQANNNAQTIICTL